MQDFEKVCRTCLRVPEDELLLPLFDDKDLPNKIHVISSVQVLDNDNLPKNVCGECVVNIYLSYNFRRVINNSDLKLRSYLAHSNNEEQPKSEIIDEVDDHDYSIDIKDYNYICEQTDGPAKDQQVEEINKLIDDTDKHNLNRVTPAMNDKHKNERQQRPVKKKPRRYKVKLYECNKCDFKTMDYNKYRGHPLNHVKKLCSICGKSISAANFTKHFDMHNAPPVECKECGKVFKNSSCLRSHMLLHKGVNRTCKVCGEWYKERAAYRAHVKTHQDKDDTVACPLCDKRVKRPCLKGHIRSHTGERPYPCEFCKKGFSSSYALKTHRRQHTNERPYKCALCPMAFPQRVSLRTHLKSKHKIKQETSAS